MRIGSTNLHVEEVGEGTPVVLIHGLTLDCRMWWLQVPALAARFRVITYDSRGFGRSDEPSGEPCRDWEDLRALLDVLRIEKAHVAGLSRGGRVALEFARHCPERMLKLAVIDTAPRLVDGPLAGQDSLGSIRRVVTELAARNPAEAAEAWLGADIWRSSKGSTDPKLIAMVRDYFARHRWGSATRNTDLSMADLASIGAESLVMVGSEDNDEFQESAKQLGELLRNSTLRTIRDAGHISNVDNPEFVNESLIGFLR